MEKKIKHKEVKKLIKTNEFEEMIKRLQESFKKQRDNFIIIVIVTIILIAGIIFYINNKKITEEKAEKILSRANFMLTRPVVDSKDASMYGMFKSKEEKYEKAISAYQEIIQTYRSSKVLPFAYLGVADAYFNIEKYKEALEYYNTFIDKFPKHNMFAEALFGRAITYYQLSQYKEALADFKLILEKYPQTYNIQDIKIKKAQCHLKLNEKNEAKSILQNIKPDDGAYWYGLAQNILEGLK
ncbi:MAG: tetratricopeptide repeat protein [Candidatus Goldbacteria bacterium]|nr:tetratricopeptide repeat protein [Candidatus Goldiibacteriota bacterium]